MSSKRIAQKLHSLPGGRTFQLDTFDVDLASFDLERGEANVQAHVAYNAQTLDGNQHYRGHCMVNFTHHSDRWCIRGFKLPGFGG